MIDIYEGGARLRLTPSDQPNQFEHRIFKGDAPVISYDDNKSFTMPYRLLSKSVLQKHGLWGLVVVDYTAGETLKESTGLVKGITIISDHEARAGNWFGKVIDSEWSDSINGVDVAGINGVCRFAIDDSDSDRAWIQKGIREGYLQGMSVGIWQDWEQSHPDLDLFDFVTQMGEEVDGEIVRMVATKIHRFFETSVCIAGVDANANPIREVEDEKEAGELLAHLSQSGWSFRPPKSQVTTLEGLKMAEDTKNKGVSVDDLQEYKAEMDAKMLELTGRLESEIQRNQALEQELTQAKIDSESQEITMYCESLRNSKIQRKDGEFILSQSFVDLSENVLKNSTDTKVELKAKLGSFVEGVVSLATKGAILVPVTNQHEQSHADPDNNGGDEFEGLSIDQIRFRAKEAHLSEAREDHSIAWSLAANDPKYAKYFQVKGGK